MPADLNRIDILTRREIEALMAGPLIKAFIDELGQERTLAVVSRVIESLAFESGVQLAKRMGNNGMASLAEGFKTWGSGGAYELEHLLLSETRYEFNIRKCRYADMYRELGMADLGRILSCSRDFKLITGFNSRMRLVRTKTIMEGFDHCDFRIMME